MDAIYTRVSTEDQAKSGYSLSDQVESCRQKLDSISNGEIKDYVDDGYSGEFLERPALSRLRNDVQLGLIKNIMILDPDRLSRNMAHTLMLKEEFEKSGAKLHFINGSYDNTPEGDLFFKIRASIASFEKEKIRQRTMSGKKRKALEGKVTNLPKFGYDWDKNSSTYVINNEQAKIVKLIYSMCIDQQMGLKRIAKELNEHGYQNGQGNPFLFKYVYKILTDESYYGEYYKFREQWVKTGQKTYDVTKVPKEHQVVIPIPAIISKEDHTKAKKQLAANFSGGKRNRRHDYLLTGLIKCGLCGRGMVAVPFKKGKLRYYICYGLRNMKDCNSAYIPVEEIETDVWDYITLIAEGKNQFEQPRLVDKSKEIHEIDKKIKELRQLQDNITNLIFENLINTDAAKKKLKSIVKELSIHVTRKQELETVQNSSIRKIPIIKLSDVINAKTTAQKHELIKKAGLTIKVYKEKGQEIGFRVVF